MTQVPLKVVASINDEKLPESTPSDRVLRYVDISAVAEGRICGPVTEVQFGDAPSRARRLVRPGDVVVSTVRTYLRAIAPVDESHSDCVWSTGFAIVRPREVEPQYLRYALISADFVDEVVARSVGVSYPAINPRALGDIPVVLVPRAQQRRIADFLDAETARIEALVVAGERLRGLVIERTASERERLLRSWSVAMLTPLRRVARVQTGVTLNAGRTVESAVDRPYLRVANVQPGHLALDEVKLVAVTEEQIRRHTLRSGDVLMTEGGDRDKLGRGVVWRDEVPGALHQNHVFAVRPDSTRLLPEYLEMVLAGSGARRYFESTANQTTNLASTNTAIVGALPVPTPPVDQQRRIATEMEAIQHRHANIEAAIDRQIALLRERRQALITAAVTGKLQVPERPTANAAA